MQELLATEQVLIIIVPETEDVFGQKLVVVAPFVMPLKPNWRTRPGAAGESLKCKQFGRAISSTSKAHLFPALLLAKRRYAHNEFRWCHFLVDTGLCWNHMNDDKTRNSYWMLKGQQNWESEGTCSTRFMQRKLRQKRWDQKKKIEYLTDRHKKILDIKTKRLLIKGNRRDNHVRKEDKIRSHTTINEQLCWKQPMHTYEAGYTCEICFSNFI